MRIDLVNRRPTLDRLARPYVAARVWATYASIRRDVDRVELPALVARLAEVDVAPRIHCTPEALSATVDRVLRVGRHPPTCLLSALVLFRLLRAQGDVADLVIGLPPVARTEEAHAWVECDGRDVGPPPGRGRYRELARFP